jgi:hypothetical protein
METDATSRFQPSHRSRKITRLELGSELMAEVEIHTGHGHSDDEFGRRVGVMVGIIGIILAFVTISSHRAHTAAVIARTEANDQWSFYQSKKLRQHLAEIGASLAGNLSNDPARVETLIHKLDGDSKRYADDSKTIEENAHGKEGDSMHEERRAIWERDSSSWGWCCRPSTFSRSSVCFRPLAASPR